MNKSQNFVLFVDDDQALAGTIGKYLSSIGYKVALAANGREALELSAELRPDVIVADLHMPIMNGIELLEEAKRTGDTIPVIITTGYPDVETAISAMRKGAFDYIVKPFKLDLLKEKIDQAIRANSRIHDNAVLNELVSLQEITTRLTDTHDLNTLLETTFLYCLEAIKADGGVVAIADRATGMFNVVSRRDMEPAPDHSAIKDMVHWAAEKWAIENNQSLLSSEGVSSPENIDRAAIPADGSSALAVPVRVAGTVVGAVGLRRKPGQNPFSNVDLNMVEVLANQAGIAISNAHLYASVNQKLEELSLISTYSEQLMGLVDKDDIITCLFETVRKHFNVDVMAFLVVQKRQHQFLFWSKGELPRESRDKIRRQVITWYNEQNGTDILEKQASFRPLRLTAERNATVITDLGFSNILPVSLEGSRYGAVYFGALEKPAEEDEMSILLSSLVSQTRIALTNARLYEDMKENYIKTIKALAIAVDAKDNYTHNHSESVMNIGEEIAREIGMDAKWVGVIRDAGLLHDIGKIGIPGNILNRTGPLTYEEFNGIMKTHTIMGANIVRDVPFLQDLYPLILHHHENWDGSGYPDELLSEDIPLGARIIRVADAFEAMTSNRPYRASLGTDEAIRRLIEGRGRQFDPAIVDAMFVVAKRKGWITELPVIPEGSDSANTTPVSAAVV